MITRDEAAKCVLAFYARDRDIPWRTYGGAFKEDGLLEIEHELTEEKWYGWVFHLQSREYLQTRDERHLMLGLGPTVVLKDTGEVFPLGSARPPEILLMEFERDLMAQRGEDAKDEQ